MREKDEILNALDTLDTEFATAEERGDVLSGTVINILRACLKWTCDESFRGAFQTALDGMRKEQAARRKSKSSRTN